MRQSAGTPGTMYWGILPVVFFVFAEAAKFDNRVYLPPSNWKEAGGREDDLLPPLEPPYIDPYSDNRHLVPAVGRRGFNRGYKPRKESPRSWDGNEDEYQIRNFPDGFGKPKSRFLYGSYSYTGPDNILVTVTYTADRKKSKGRRRFYGDDYDDYPGRMFSGYDADDYDYDGPLEGGVVPTPPGLPHELHKAFAFHKKQHQLDNEGKTGKALPTTRQPWNEHSTQKPIIHQGYSYPKPNTAKN